MADTKDALSTLDDLLGGLADSILLAQAELARAGGQGPAGQKTRYVMPKIEFELKMNLQVVESLELTNRYRGLRPDRASAKHLMFQPAQTGPSNSSLEIAATIRGAFVAVPANEGMAAISLQTQVSKPSAGKITVTVTARSAAGEPISGLAVEFNVDREQSKALTVSAKGQALGLDDSKASFSQGVDSTDAKGVATAVLDLGTTAKGALIAVVIDAAERTETIVCEVS